MGVRGLLKYIRSDRSTIKLYPIRLFKRGEEKEILVCDLMAVFYWLIELLHKAKVTNKDYSQYSAIYGGNFKDYRERILEFVKALRFINVEPVFFYDGPPGSSFDYELKLETWRDRSRKILRKVRDNAEICKFHATEIKFEKRIKQTLLFEELVHALREAGVVVNLCEGEADNIMAQYVREHKEVCTILTNDTDMALMSGVSMVHYKFFDRQDTLEINRPVLRRSHEICCDIMKPQYLARDLKIDEKCLPALSILCGNDFTSVLNERIDIMKVLGFSYPIIASVSVWIKHHENDCKSADSFLSIKQIKEICEDFPEYSQVVIHSYNFYQSGKPPPEPSDFPAASPIHSVIVEKVKAYQMDRQFLPIVKNGIMWRDEIEQLDERLPCIHETLQPVRNLLYKLLCISCVTEYGQHGVNEFVQLRIDVTPCRPETLSTLTKLPFDVKIILIFNALLTCTEQNVGRLNDDKISKNVFLLGSIPEQKLPIAATDKLKDTEKIKEYFGAALTCSCILFAIKNKLIPETYIVPLIMACFCCAMDETPPKLAARPGPTGVTIAAHFMLILKHARLLASLLGLEELLPLPSTIFQPFVYIPLHGSAFKISQKEHFHNDDKKVQEYYQDLSLNKSFVKFKNLITTPISSFASAIIDQYLETKAKLPDRKVAATHHKSLKATKKKK